MQFLSPIWFFALAALSIPVVIHLWNIKAGKTLKVGSISLISEASKTNRRSFKLLDILLFILRCLFLAMVACFLALPVWKQLAGKSKAIGWVMMPQESFTETYNKFKPQVDSLTRSGYEFHYFNSRFAKAELNKVIANTIRKDTLTTTNYWGLVNQLNTKAIALPVYIFTPNGAGHFKGEKPSTALNLHWQTYTAADSVSKWIARANLTANNTIQIIQGSSNPQGIYYTRQNISNEASPVIDVKVQAGRPMVALKSSNQPPVLVDTSTLRIAIYTDQYALDAGYLKAALLAATDFMGNKAIVRQYTNAAQIPARENWLFWLSDRPVSNTLLQNTWNVMKYDGGKSTGVSSWINTGDKYALANKNGIDLNKLILSTDKNEPVWSDGFGRPVLSAQKHNQTKIYHLYSHFNPQWNDLVWSDSFPQLILSLINEDSDQIPAGYDKRVLDSEQIKPLPQVTAAHTSASVNPYRLVDIAPYFWLLLVVLFLAERILSHKTNKIPTNG